MREEHKTRMLPPLRTYAIHAYANARASLLIVGNIQYSNVSLVLRELA